VYLVNGGEPKSARCRRMSVHRDKPLEHGDEAAASLTKSLASAGWRHGGAVTGENGVFLGTIFRSLR